MRPTEEERDHQAIQREELGIYAIIIAASAPVVIGLAIEGGQIDAGATLSLVLVVFGIVGLVAGVLAAIRTFVKPRLPVATARRRS
jgi:hypothetical protein